MVKKIWILFLSIIFLGQGVVCFAIPLIPSDLLNGTDSFFSEHYLIKLNSGKTIYLVDRGLRRVVNQKIITSYGLTNSDIRIVTKKRMSEYPVATLIRKRGGATVYWLKNNVKYPIATIGAFNRRKFDWEKIVEVNDVEFSYYRIGKTLR